MTQKWWLIMITFSVKPVLHQSKEWSSFFKIKQLLITWPKADMFHTQVIHKGRLLSPKKSYNHKMSWKLISRYGKLLRSCCQRRRNNCFVERKHGHVWKTIFIFIPIFLRFWMASDSQIMWFSQTFQSQYHSIFPNSSYFSFLQG